MKLNSKIKQETNQLNDVLPWCNGCVFLCTDCFLACSGTCAGQCLGSDRL